MGGLLSLVIWDLTKLDVGYVYSKGSVTRVGYGSRGDGVFIARSHIGPNSSIECLEIMYPGSGVFEAIESLIKAFIDKYILHFLITSAQPSLSGTLIRPQKTPMHILSSVLHINLITYLDLCWHLPPPEGPRQNVNQHGQDKAIACEKSSMMVVMVQVCLV